MKIFASWKVLSAGLLLAMSLPAFAASSTASNAMSDTVITAKIKSNLATDKTTNALNITVETNNGIVTLGGTAKSNTEASTAVKIAEATDGVKDVNANNLKVVGETQPLTDTYITAKVEGMFIKHNMTPGTQSVPLSTIKIETREGIVYLSGNVQSKEQMQKAETLAKSVDGVKKVNSSLKIS